MKKISFLLMLVAMVFSQACRGPEGLPGPQGEPGPAGGLEYGSVFDITGTFTADNNYSLFFDFPTDEVEVFESDIVLVYIEWETTEQASVWRLLPQVVFQDQGLLQYNFDHTPADVSIFLEGEVDLATLDPAWTANQVFRVVIVPATFADEKARQDMDFSNYGEVIKRYNLSDKKVRTFRATK